MSLLNSKEKFHTTTERTRYYRTIGELKLAMEVSELHEVKKLSWSLLHQVAPRRCAVVDLATHKTALDGKSKL
jgi:hypothetical protein